MTKTKTTKPPRDRVEQAILKLDPVRQARLALEQAYDVLKREGASAATLDEVAETHGLYLIREDALEAAYRRAKASHERHGGRSAY